MTFIIASEKTWHQQMYQNLQKRFSNHSWVLIDKKEELTVSRLDELAPTKIFFPHWSYIIPSSIYNSYECIVFHMTDLPFGRGGSPLQNLILKGHHSTKVSAFRVEQGIDAGPIYLKKELNLEGSAQEIFLRCTNVIEEMISEIIEKEFQPQPQAGTPVLFKRRTPEQSSIAALKDLQEIYDYIRMLDAEGYPHAFIETDNFKLEFTNASLQNDKAVIANVRITKK